MVKIYIALNLIKLVTYINKFPVVVTQLARFLTKYEVFPDMSNLENSVNKVIDATSNLIEKVATPASRAGSTVERAGRMLEEGVDADVIALQMKKNSPNGTKYTRSKVEAYGELYQDSKTSVMITAAVARSLIKDQKEISPNLNDSNPQR